MEETKSLRLLGETPDDLAIISAAIQDAVVKAENLKYDAKARRFTLELNRYRWEKSGSVKDGERVRSLLAIDGVLTARTLAVHKNDPDLIYSLLSLSFTPASEPPGGTLSLMFAGDGEIVLDVEVLDVSLLDSSYVWPTTKRPSHKE